jgi:hypothetical protein
MTKNTFFYYFYSLLGYRLLAGPAERGRPVVGHHPATTSTTTTSGCGPDIPLDDQ